MIVLTLNCAFVGVAGSAFPVDIDENALVGHLKDAMKAKNENELKDVDAKHLQLFHTKTADGAWLTEADVKNGVKDTDGLTPLDVAGAPLNLVDLSVEDVRFRLTKEVVKAKKTPVHVLVVVDRKCLETLEAPETQIEPHPSRKRRWDKLNVVLDKNKKAKKSVGSTGFSYVSFREINNIMPATEYEQTSKPIPDEKLDAVHGYFPILIKAFGDIVTGKEAKRLHFIVPVLASVCALFNGDVRILAEETVEGKRVHGDGDFEFVLQRGDKRVCVVEAKRDDIQQGLAQAYVGSEALADVKGLTKVYSIVTNFVEWYFSKSLDDKIERTSPITMVMENYVPTRESVKRIAGMIYSILSDDN